MNITEFRDIIKKRATLDPNDDFETENCWKTEVAILSESINNTIHFLQNECTEDEFAWISEVIDDLVETTKSKELLDCYKTQMSRFPNACKTNNIAFCIECAEAILK